MVRESSTKTAKIGSLEITGYTVTIKIVGSSGTESVDLAEKALQHIALLPDLELYSERRKVLDKIGEQCNVKPLPKVFSLI